MAAPNWSNQTIWTGDNLTIMRGMNSDTIDLIYLDPPFNSNADYSAPIGSAAAGAEFRDTWGLDDINLAWHGLIKHEHPGLYDMLLAVRRIHGDSMMSYLIYMTPRLMEMRRILKDTGSVYLHCDPTASHYLKLIMDAIFGKSRFRNEVVWRYGKIAKSSKDFTRNHDILLRYTKGENWTFNKLKKEDSELKTRWARLVEDNKIYYRNLKNSKDKIARLRINKLERELDRALADDDVLYDFDTEFKPLDDVIYASSLKGNSGERTGYPTQKPLALIERIIAASSNTGDVVLDPFCGCATACIAAQRLDRKWVGIDISDKAAELVEMRMQKELGLLYKGTHRQDIPSRNDLGAVPKYNCAENKNWLYGQQGGFCNACATHFQPRHLTIDHIIARKEGGSDHISNLQLLCGSCNSIKGKRSHAWLMSRLTNKGHIKREVMGTDRIDTGWETLQLLAATAAADDSGATERALARRREKIAARTAASEAT